MKLRRNLSFPLWEITRILPAGKLTRARSSQEEFCMLLLSEGSKAKHDAWTIVIFMIHTHLSSTKECSMDINVLYQGKTSHVLDQSTMVSWELDPNFHYKTLISNLIQYTSKTSMILSLNFYKMKIVMPIILYMAPSFCRGYLFSDTVKTYFWGKLGCLRFLKASSFFLSSKKSPELCLQGNSYRKTPKRLDSSPR